VSYTPDDKYSGIKVKSLLMPLPYNLGTELFIFQIKRQIHFC
jgi:hypothetical protein